MADQPIRPIEPPASIAFIGLGNMGEPMAARLVAAGYGVRGFDNSADVRARVASAVGLTASASVAEAVRDADAVVTMLPTGKIVRAVIVGFVSVLKPGTLVVDMSSSEPIGTRALAEEVTASGLQFVDAPVSGGVKRAVNGTLAIMVGGDEGAVDKAEPLLKAMGTSIIRTGPAGSGHAIKALNNYVSGAGLIAAVEALEVGRRFGLDPNVIVDVFNASTGKNNTTEVKLKPFVISEAYNSGFFIGLMSKDIRTAHTLARELGVPVPLADRCADLWDEATQRLGATADHTEVYKGLI